MGTTRPVAHCKGNVPERRILLNSICNGSIRISVAFLKYSFIILSTPHALFAERLFIADMVSFCENGSSREGKLVSLSLLSKFSTKALISSGRVSSISDDRFLKYSKNHYQIYYAKDFVLFKCFQNSFGLFFLFHSFLCSCHGYICFYIFCKNTCNLSYKQKP